MYYLDFHKLYKSTTKQTRSEVRISLKRDEIMVKKLKMQINTCFYCGISINMTSHLDHLIPVKYGGTNRLSNLVASCRDCNLWKNTDQIEITNEFTIKSYLRMIKAHKRLHGRWYAGKDKHYRLYNLYRADLFRYLP